MEIITSKLQMHQCIGNYGLDNILFWVSSKFLTISVQNFRNQTKISKADLDVYSMFMPMAMFFYILFYVSMPFNEERTEFKKMQPISPFIYWTSVFLFDALIHAMFAYFMYTIHIWSDTHHIFEAKEYGKITYNF